MNIAATTNVWFPSKGEEMKENTTEKIVKQ